MTLTASAINSKGCGGKRRKLKALIITMPGSERHAHMEALFAQDNMKEHFEPPQFCPGVPSRRLRNRFEFLRYAHQAGLIPDDEWDALVLGHENPEYRNCPNRFFECLKDVPVRPGRRGSKSDVQVHYSVELWRKAKGINRGRAVLGCMLAHLIALKKYIDEGFDVMLEDNVRTPAFDCAERVWEAMEATREWETTQQRSSNNQQQAKCHLRFLGWLGSIPNINWILQRHVPKRAFRRIGEVEPESTSYSIVPFPKTQEIISDLEETETESENGINEPTAPAENEANENDAGSKTSHRKPGGNPVWGSYAYWISKEGYQALLARLRNDVGALLWKGKRMRHYIVKPADKILPRILMDHFGQEAVQLTTYPAFFRAPMLTSKIHTQWDPEFCKSTECQLQQTGNLTWSDLWLTDDEKNIVTHHQKHGEWITLGRLMELQAESETT